jgi:hypothetical protein
MSEICRYPVRVLSQDVIMGLCPQCAHSLLLHAGPDGCAVCALLSLPRALAQLDQRVTQLERDDGIRLL